MLPLVVSFLVSFLYFQIIRKCLRHLLCYISTDTPPKVAPHLSGVTGTPGVQLHSVLHPTPLKPRPLETGGSAGESGEGVESEGGDMREQVRQFSSYSATSRRKRKVCECVMCECGESVIFSYPRDPRDYQMEPAHPHTLTPPHPLLLPQHLIAATNFNH